MKQSDLTKLKQRLSKFLEATNEARGEAKDLVRAAPLELHLYNLATATKRELEGFIAMIDDFEGNYLKKETK